MKQLMAWFAGKKINPVVSEQFPLARASEAIQRLLDRKVKGKVVILPEE
jgi:NADPH2:quinone reductase